MTTFNKSNIANLIATNFKLKEFDAPSLGDGVKILVKRMSYQEMEEFATAPQKTQFIKAALFGMVESDSSRVFANEDEVSGSLTMAQIGEVASIVANYTSTDVKTIAKK
jgi:cytidylate kinase